MSENLPTTERKPMTLRDRLSSMTPEFSKALPAHIPPEKFVRTVQTAVQMNPDISEACKTRTGVQSLMAACTKAATDGLILDGREAALVTFNSKVTEKGQPDRWEKQIQYIPMVAGLMKKARNSGQIASIAAHLVYEKDDFSYVLGDEEKIVHQPKFGDRGRAVAVYAIVKLKDGSVQREVMDRSQVIAIGAQGRNGFQYDPEKGKNFGEWWRKTVIRRISKYLPSSSDRDEFLQAVARIDDDYDFDATDGGEIEPAQEPKKRRGAGAAALKDVTPTQKQEEHREEPPHDPQTGEIIDGDVTDKQPGDDI